MEKLVQDVRYAFRSLIRQPAFAATAILTLALGIGATTAIFSVVNAVLMRPLPFPDPARLVAVTNFWTKTGLRGSSVSAPDFHDWKAQSQSFAAMGYWSGGETSVTTANMADYAFAYRVTPGFLEALGAKAARGRLLSTDDHAAGAALAVVITDAYWKKQFNGQDSAIGSTLKFNDRLFTIAGVMEPGQRYPARADIYYPAWTVSETRSRSGHNYRVVARLKDDVSLEQARAEMAGIAQRLSVQFPETNEGKSSALVSLQELVVGDTRQTLYILLGAVALVLLIACANVANLLLARATGREREMVVRAAVGAGRERLVRQLLTESAVLGVLAAVAGVWLARLGVIGLIALAPANLPRIDEIRVDGTVLIFALAVAVFASLVFGLAPALHVSRVQLADGLRQGGKGSSLGARGGWARQAFVMVEIALAVVLVVAASLVGRSLAELSSVDLGFEREHVLVVEAAVPVRTWSEAPRAAAFYRELLQDVRALPGVVAAAGVTSLPTAVRSTGAYAIDGASIEQLGTGAPQAVLNVVTPEYFRTMQIPIKGGRDFNDRDRSGGALVAIVNEALAREAFGGRDPIGRRIQCGLDMLDVMTVVGVVADVRTTGPASPPQPEIYMPNEQHPAPATALNIVARTQAGDPLAFVETIRRKVRELNPDVPLKASTMVGTLELAAATPRFRTFLIVVFAGVALLLALAGVYGVMAYTVSQRIPELGVRIALGATPGNILGLVVGQGAKLAAAGLTLGIGLALLSGRWLEGILFGVTARDPYIFALVTLAVAVAALAACLIPARHAIRVDPMQALRAQ